MTKHTDRIGDEYDVTEIGGRVTVMRGCSVVMDCVVEGKDIRILHSSYAAPSKLFVMECLGLVEKPAPKPSVPAGAFSEPDPAPDPDESPKPPTKRRRSLNR